MTVQVATRGSSSYLMVPVATQRVHWLHFGACGYPEVQVAI
jgi:hypothetical protein